jgi:hypothetical protein
MIIRGAALLGLAIISTVPARARSQDHTDHTDHAAHIAQTARSLGGTFALRAIDGRALPAALREGADARIVAGSLTLTLVRPDSGRYARSSSVVASGGNAVVQAEQGVVVVRGDTLLFRPEGSESQRPFRNRHAWTAERALELTDALGHVWRYVPIGADSGFAGVQARGADVMGVDQYTSSHVFEALPDGGRIVLQRDVADAEGEAIIRAHLRDIVARFTKGDFSLPGQVHGMVVAGTGVMAERKRRIRYVMEPLPRGGQVRIVTRDATALKAVHEFLAFQRMDHRAAGHDHE